jgi:hypothetical protein
MAAAGCLVSAAVIEWMMQTYVDPVKYNWAEILMLFTVVLPHSKEEAQTPQANEGYRWMFAFFSPTSMYLDAKKCGSIAKQSKASLMNSRMMIWSILSLMVHR